MSLRSLRRSAFVAPLAAALLAACAGSPTEPDSTPRPFRWAVDSLSSGFHAAVTDAVVPGVDSAAARVDSVVVGGAR